MRREERLPWRPDQEEETDTRHRSHTCQRHAVEKRGLCQTDGKMAERTRQKRDTGVREATDDRAAGEERSSVVGTAAAVWGSEMRRLRRPRSGRQSRARAGP